MGDVKVTLGGLDLFGTDSFGVKWTTGSWEGWNGSPRPTISPVQKPRAHGAWAGNSYYGARHMVGAGIIEAPSQAALSAAIDRLNDACSLDETVLTVAEQGRSRWCMARAEDDVLAPMLTDTIARWSIQTVALDPRKLGAPLSGNSHLPSFSGGLTVPFTVLFSIDSARVTGQVNLANPGNATGPVKMSIDGPCSGPVITHVASGLSLVFSASLILGAGEWIDIDMEAHTVMANGQSSRANWITSRGWSGFEPGSNTWAFTAASYTAGALMTVTATPAWK